MASVRMSNDLRKRIINNGNRLFDKSINVLQETLAGDIHDRAAKEFVDFKFKKYIDLVPDEWIDTIGRVNYKIKFTVGEGEESVYSFNDETLIKTLKIVRLHGLYSYGFGNPHILNIPDGFTFSQGLSDEVTKWRSKIMATSLEQTTFINELKGILKRCNTIKQFLDTWPQGENIVPSDILTKLNVKPIREKKVPLITEEASVALSTTLLKRTLMS